MDANGTIDLTSDGTVNAYAELQSLIQDKITPYGYSSRKSATRSVRAPSDSSTTSRRA
jgi:hypothetical protein